MKLLGVMGAGLLAAGFCCCGGGEDGPLGKIRALLGKEDAAPVEAAAPAPSAPVAVQEKEVKIGVPPGAVTQPAPEGVFLRYTQNTMTVEGARQYHDHWLRNHGWQPQVDAATASGWTMEAVKDDDRLIIDIQPLGTQGVNVVFKLL